MGTAFNIIWCMIMRTQVDWITPCAWPRSFQKVVYFCNMGIMLWPVAVRKATWSLISRTRTDTDPSVHLCNKRAQHTRGWDQVHLHSRETERRIESYVICDGMVTHTRNLCSAFNQSKMRTHTPWTHTRSSGQPFTVPGSQLRRWGTVGGSVPCSRALQSWYWGWREHCTFTPPTYNSCRPDTRTRNFWVTSLTF